MRTTRRFMIGCLMVMLALFGAAGAYGAPFLQDGAEPPLLDPPTRGTNRGPFFQVSCLSAHRAHDDPIVVPGQEHATHEHQFYGNLTTDGSSTQESLLDGDTSCETDRDDTAAYWAPTLYNSEGEMQRVFRVRAYYYAHSNDKDALQAYPPGLRVIAGNPRATSPQPDGVIRWLCREKGNQQDELELDSSSPPRCESGEFLSLMIRFPNCLAQNSDGTPMLDSSDHRRHMAYADADESCPQTHPIRVPKLRLSFTYEPDDYRGGNFTLGGPQGGHHVLPWQAMHADFWNSWDQQALDEYVEECLKEGSTDRPASCNKVLNRP